MTLVGKWVTIPDLENEGYFQDGQITDQIGTDFFLIRLHNVIDGPPHSRIFLIADLAEAFFFETEAELDRFREWTTGDPAKILKFEK
jgi:hypothetical protein